MSYLNEEQLNLIENLIGNVDQQATVRELSFALQNDSEAIVERLGNPDISESIDAVKSRLQDAFRRAHTLYPHNPVKKLELAYGPIFDFFVANGGAEGKVESLPNDVKALLDDIVESIRQEAVR